MMIISCECGHKGSAKYRENDSLYSSYGIWTFTDLDCRKRQVEKPGQMSLFEAIESAEPKCPSCGTSIDSQKYLKD
ncbi:MAG: hypothetical protein WAqPseu_02680 [Shewanella algae]